MGLSAAPDVGRAVANTTQMLAKVSLHSALSTPGFISFAPHQHNTYSTYSAVVTY
jgi:hypothetical protein